MPVITSSQIIIQSLKKTFKKTDENTASDLYGGVKRAYAEVRRARCNWNQITKQAFLLEDILNNRNNPKKYVESPLRTKITGRFADLREKFRWYWLVEYKKKVKFIYSILLAILSFVLIWDETCIFFNNRTYSILDKVLHIYLDDPEVGYLASQIVCTIPLAYIVFNVYYGFFRFKINGFYGIYANNNTDGSSLLFTAVNFSRLPGPLCFNFLAMIDFPGTAFNNIMGNINLVPVFGSQTTSFFPMMMICFAVFHAFELWTKMFVCLGLKQLIFMPAFDISKSEEGKIILQKKRKKAEYKLIRKSKISQIDNNINDQNERLSIMMVFIERHDSDIASASEDDD